MTKNSEQILYTDNIPRCIFREVDNFNVLLETLTHHNQKEGWTIYTIKDMLNKKIITSKYFCNLKEEINKILELEEFSRFKWILEDVQYYLEDAEDCIYIKPLEIELESFLMKLINKHINNWKQNPDEYESVVKVISNRFDNLEDHGFLINDASNSMTITEVLRHEVIDYFGGTCWEKAEMEINDLTSVEREKLTLDECIELIYCCCIENS
ncbi:MAG: hypothetical protein CV087_02550 [Candidatus Brocadia sp. WS118]|nr:MAG: hypothetical protein CV087_02550 [Candidatus Brocadia sp. WS118]